MKVDVFVTWLVSNPWSVSHLFVFVMLRFFFFCCCVVKELAKSVPSCLLQLWLYLLVITLQNDNFIMYVYARDHASMCAQKVAVRVSEVDVFAQKINNK